MSEQRMIVVHARGVIAERTPATLTLKSRVEIRTNMRRAALQQV